MLKKGALAIALAGYVLAGTTAASAGQRAGSAAFPAVKPVQETIAPAKRRVAKDAEFVAGAGLLLPIVIGAVVLVSVIVVATSGGNDSSPN